MIVSTATSPCITLVESHAPPKPTSITMASTALSANQDQAAAHETEAARGRPDPMVAVADQVLREDREDREPEEAQAMRRPLITATVGSLRTKVRMAKRFDIRGTGTVISPA